MDYGCVGKTCGGVPQLAFVIAVVRERLVSQNDDRRPGALPADPPPARSDPAPRRHLRASVRALILLTKLSKHIRRLPRVGRQLRNLWTQRIIPPRHQQPTVPC